MDRCKIELFQQLNFVLSLCQQTSNPITNNCWQVKFFHKRAIKERCITPFFQGRTEALGKKDNNFAQFQTLKLFSEFANIKENIGIIHWWPASFTGRRSPSYLSFVSLFALKWYLRIDKLLSYYYFTVSEFMGETKSLKQVTNSALKTSWESNVKSNLKIKYFTLWMYYSHE